MYYDGAWSEEERLTINARESGHPSVAVDQADNVHVVWQGLRLNDGGIFHKFNDGTGWSEQTKAPGSTMNARYPSCAVDDSGKVHVVWTQVCTLPGDALRYSVWDGAEWSPYADIDVNPCWTYSTPCIVAAPGGELHVGWDRRPSSNEFKQIYYYHYDGVSWEPGEQLTYGPLRARHPSLAVYGDKVYMVYADSRVGEDEIYCRVRADGAWSTEMGLSFANGESVYPAVAADNTGRVHVVWQDGRYGPSELYYRMWATGDISGISDDEAAQLEHRDVRVLGNPVGRAAEMSFSLERSTVAAVSIYDVTGRLVWLRDMGVLGPGEHHLTWPATDQAGKAISPGIYLVRLKAGATASTAKAVIIGN